MPKSYLEADSGFFYECWDNHITNPTVYGIVKKDSSIRIGFNLQNTTGPVTLARIRAITPGWDPDLNYMKMIKGYADTVNHKINIYEDGYVKETSNADHGGEFTRNCIVPFQKKYLYNRIVIVAKKNRGEIILTYLYTEAAKATIDEEIKRTLKMIRYKD